MKDFNDDKKKAKKKEFSLDDIRNDITTRKQLQGFIEEIVGAYGAIKTQQETIRDIREEAYESLGIPTKILNKLVKEELAPGTLEAEQTILEEVQEISDAITARPSGPKAPTAGDGA